MSRKRLNTSLQQALLDAIWNADTAGVLRCLENGADVNAPYRGSTPLIAAAVRDLVQVLVSHGADVNHADSSGETALMVACSHGYSGTAEYLLRHDAAVDLQDKHGRTALMHASLGGSNCIAPLARGGADLDQPDRSGLTALDYAYKNRLHSSVVELMRQGADIQKTKLVHSRQAKSAVRWISVIAPALQAVDDGDYTTLETLLENGAPTDARNADNSKDPLLLTAAAEGHVNIIQLLLKHGADVNITNVPNGRSALIEAAFNGRKEAVAVLLEHGANASYRTKDGLDAAYFASIYGDPDIGKMIRRYWPLNQS